MASHGRAAAKPKAAPARTHQASGTFRAGTRDEQGTLAAVERLTARSAGRPLDDGTRAEMEGLFAHDFGAILVHTDEAAAEAAEVLDAEAFTLGDDVYFAEGAYRPGDESGEALIAHELAHVVQRDGALTGGEATRVSEEDDAVEQEAEAIAREALRSDGGDPGDVAGGIEAASRTIGRRATRPSKKGKHKKEKKAKAPKEPSLPLGEMPIVERLAGIVLGNFAKDAKDKSGRIRRQLARLGEKTRAEVLATIDARLADADKRKLAALVAKEAPPGTEVSTPAANEAETTDAEQRDRKTAEERKQSAVHEAGADAKGEQSADAKAEADAHGDAHPDADAMAEGNAPADADAEGNAKAGDEEPEKKEQAKEKEGAGSEAPEKPKLGEGEQAAPKAGEEGAGAAGEGPKGAAPKGAGGAPAGGAGGEGDAGGDAVDVTPFDALLARKAGGAAAIKKGPTAGPIGAGAGPAMGESAEAPTAEGATPEGPTPGAPMGAEPEASGADGAGAEADAATGEASAAEGPKAPGEKPATPEAKEPAQEKEPEAAPTPEPNASSEPTEGAEASPAEAPAAEPPAPEAAPAPAAAAPEPALKEEAKEETKAGGEAAMGAPPAPAAAGEESEPPALPEVGATEAAGEATGGGEAESANTNTDAGANADAGAAPGPSADASAATGANADVDAGPSAEAAPGPSADADAGAAPGPSADAGAAPGTDADAGAVPGPSADAGADMGGGGGEVSGGGGGGGGGGSPIEDKPPPAAPDVSASSPSQAMAAMASLPPATLKASLGGVTAATNRAMDAERTDLASNPPQVDRPSGAPATHPPAANVADLASKVPNDPAGKVDAVPPGEAVAPPVPPAPPQFAPPPPLPSPVVAGDAKISAENAAQVQAAADNLPTTDPELNVTAGDAPALSLEGDADPQQAKDQRENLDASVQGAQEQGAKDAAQPMGETEVYPDTPAETLKAKVPEGGGAAAGGEGGPAAAAGAGGAAGGGGGGGEVDEETASIVAQEQQGDAIQAQVQGKSSEMEAEKAKKDQDSQKEKTDAQEKIDGAIEDDAKEQKDERDGVQKEVKEQREKWTDGQKDAVAKGNEKADKANADADKEIGKQQKDGQVEAKGHIDDGNKEIGDARQDAEGKAKDERKKAKTETSSGGFFDWLGSKVKSFFDGIKNAIKAAFDAARKLVKAAIKKAQELAAKAIEAARKAIVKAIHVVGDALIAIGDEVLGAFPELRDKYKKFIQDRVQAAEDTVNKLAEGLKKAITELLDLLGKALDAILGLLEKAYLAAVDAVAKFVDGAIKAAKAVAQALAAFAVLIKDVAAGPGKWIRNLGSAVVDGIRNHLVKAFKRQIKEWFNSTVEQVLGIGKALIAFLKKGGISWSMIGKMAWEALKSAIPGFLIGLLVEKLVAMIVPAAAAVMAIIEGLQAAWGAIQRIIAAFQLFFAFLKAVKGGNAGPQFAEALAAAAIVVIQFVAFWLLKKLIKPASKVGAKLREIAKKIGGALKKAGKAIVKGVKAVGRAVVKGAKAVGRVIKKGVQAVGKAIKKVGEKIKNSKIWKKIANSKIGKKLKAAYEKTRAKIKEWKEKAKKKYEEWKKKRAERKAKRKEERERKLRERLEKVVSEIGSELGPYLAHGAGPVRLWGRLRVLQVKHRLTWLTWHRTGEFEARINPKMPVPGVRGKRIADSELGRLLMPIFARAETDYANRLLQDPTAQAAMEAAAGHEAAGTKGSLQGLTPFERARVLAKGGAKSGRRNVLPGIDVWSPGGGAKGAVQNISPSRYGADPDTGAPGMMAAILRRAKDMGVSEKEVGALLGGSEAARQQGLQALRARLGVGVSKTRLAQGSALVNTLDRVAFLTQSFETARTPGLPTTIATSSTLLASGKAKLSDLYSSEGSLAPQTPVGAAPESGIATTPQQRAALRARERRVGATFRRLLQTASRARLVVNDGGYDLADLAAAVELFLTERLKRNATPEGLAAAEALLRLEIVRMLSTYHGR